MSTERENEKAIRAAYQIAEVQDVPGWAACFAEDGTFTDESAGITYRGRKEVGVPVEIFAKAFPDMHRELYEVRGFGDSVVVELSLNGTHKGPLETAKGVLPPTGRRLKAPCCDVFRMENGKIKSFHCYPILTDSSWV